MNESGAGRGCGSYGAAVTSANEQSGQQLPVGVISADRNGVVRAVELLENPTDCFGVVVGGRLDQSHPLAWQRALRLAEEVGWQGRGRTFAHRVALGTQAVVARRGTMQLFVGRPSSQWRPEDHLEVLLTLAQSTQDVVQIVEGAPTTAAARVVFANEAWSRLTGFPLSEILGRPPNFLTDLAGSPERVAEVAARLSAGEPARTRTLTAHASGRAVEVEVELLPVLDSADELVYWVALVRAVGTAAVERGNDRERRLEALSKLAGGIAHEFNNVLASATTNLGYARLTLREGDAVNRLEVVREVIAEVEASLLAAASLTNRLLTFSSGGSPVRRPLDVAARLAVWVGSALSPAVCPHHVTRGDAAPLVDGDRSQLRRAFDELTRFLRAGSTTGPLEVHADRTVERPGDGMAAGDYLRVTLTQPGLSLPPGALEHVFEPWSSPDQDRTLGMPIAWSIIRRHGGSLTVDSTPGGVRATVLLPAIEVERESAAPGDGAAPLEAARPLSVLVMDDEELVRTTLQRLLRHLGHHTEGAANGEEALERFTGAKARGAPFDLVLLDLTIKGGMGGAETFAALRAVDPAVIALIVSGYSSGPVIATHRELGFAGYLPKPFSVEELAGAIRGALARGADPTS